MVEAAYRGASQMAKVRLTRTAAQQIAAFRAFFADRDPAVGERAVSAILSAFRRLEAHPAMGRPSIANHALRELVIAFGSTGYVALYRIEENARRIVILAIRHQREAGYDGQQR